MVTEGPQKFILNEVNAISRSDYPDEYCLFAFDLTPDFSANDLTQLNLLKQENIRSDVRFVESLTTSLT